MTLIREYPSKTEGGTHCKVQIWKNHHDRIEGHLFMKDDRIFSSYDQADSVQALAVAFHRAKEAGY